MNKKSRTIKIFNTRYKLLFVDSIETSEEGRYFYGTFNEARKIIKISLKDVDGKPLDDNTIRESLLHELTHAILDEGKYRASSDDEPMVEWIARCLSDLINQGVI